MSATLDCQIFYDSSRQPPPALPTLQPLQPLQAQAPPGLPTPAAQVPWLQWAPRVTVCDVATDPPAAERLSRFGVAVPDDLPAMLLSGADGRLRLLGVQLRAEELARLAAGRAWAPSSMVVYMTGWCGDCRLAKRLLGEAGMEFAEVDLERDAGAESIVLRRSGGRRVVPTLEVDGRLWAFNPDPPQLRRLFAP